LPTHAPSFIKIKIKNNKKKEASVLQLVGDKNGKKWKKKKRNEKKISRRGEKTKEGRKIMHNKRKGIVAARQTFYLMHVV
jgi:hypothetical protein